MAQSYWNWAWTCDISFTTHSTFVYFWNCSSFERRIKWQMVWEKISPWNEATEDGPCLVLWCLWIWSSQASSPAAWGNQYGGYWEINSHGADLSGRVCREIHTPLNQWTMARQESSQWVRDYSLVLLEKWCILSILLLILYGLSNVLVQSICRKKYTSNLMVKANQSLLLQ